MVISGETSSLSDIDHTIQEEGGLVLAIEY